MLGRVLEEVYAAFGKTRPGAGSAQFESVLRRVANIPDEAGRWIAWQMADGDSLPANMGKSIGAWYLRWLEAHPEKQAYEAAGCGMCDNGWLRFFSRRQPFGFMVRCACAGGSAESIARYRSMPGVFEMPLRDRKLTPGGFSMHCGLLYVPDNKSDRSTGRMDASAVVSMAADQKNRAEGRVWEEWQK